MVDLRVDFCGLTFKNPVSTASGTYGFATEYGAFVPVDRLGSVTTKGLTLEPRQGNPGPVSYTHLTLPTILLV